MWVYVVVMFVSNVREVELFVVLDLFEIWVLVDWVIVGVVLVSLVYVIVVVGVEIVWY